MLVITYKKITNVNKNSESNVYHCPIKNCLVSLLTFKIHTEYVLILSLLRNIYFFTLN